jgi:hypothetical protein
VKPPPKYESDGLISMCQFQVSHHRRLGPKSDGWPLNGFAGMVRGSGEAEWAQAASETNPVRVAAVRSSSGATATRPVWSSSPRAGKSYWPTIHYRYAVGGIQFLGDRVSFRSSYNRSQAEDAVSRPGGLVRRWPSWFQAQSPQSSWRSSASRSCCWCRSRGAELPLFSCDNGSRCCSVGRCWS